MRPLRYFVVTFCTNDKPLALENMDKRKIRLGFEETYSVILLIEVVNISVQDFHKKLHRDGAVHASIRDTKSALQAFEHTLAVAVQLLNS